MDYSKNQASQIKTNGIRYAIRFFNKSTNPVILCRVCKYSPGSSIYGYGEDCSETICAIAKCIKNRY